MLNKIIILMPLLVVLLVLFVGLSYKRITVPANNWQYDNSYVVMPFGD